MKKLINIFHNWLVKIALKQSNTNRVMNIRVDRYKGIYLLTTSMEQKEFETMEELKKYLISTFQIGE